MSILKVSARCWVCNSRQSVDNIENFTCHACGQKHTRGREYMAYLSEEQCMLLLRYNKKHLPRIDGLDDEESALYRRVSASDDPKDCIIRKLLDKARCKRRAT